MNRPLTCPSPSCCASAQVHGLSSRPQQCSSNPILPSIPSAILCTALAGPHQDTTGASKFAGLQVRPTHPHALPLYRQCDLSSYASHVATGTWQKSLGESQDAAAAAHPGKPALLPLSTHRNGCHSAQAFRSQPPSSSLSPAIKAFPLPQSSKSALLLRLSFTLSSLHAWRV